MGPTPGRVMSWGWAWVTKSAICRSSSSASLGEHLDAPGGGAQAAGVRCSMSRVGRSRRLAQV
jgi:hypothetical protein